MNRNAIVASLALTLLVPTALRAGQLFGSIVFHGAGVTGAAIEINCGGAVTPGATAPGGAYRVNVPQQGQCVLTLPGYPGSSAVVFSNPNPSAYSFELIEVGGGRYELRRR